MAPFVLEEGAHAALHVPNKEVLATISGFVNRAQQLLQAVARPRVWLLVPNDVTGDHLDRFLVKTYYFADSKRW